MREDVDQVIVRIENLVRKAQLRTTGAGDVDCHVYPPQAQGNPYIVELSRERFVRRVAVGAMAVKRLEMGLPDPHLMRELRAAILAVSRMTRQRN